MDTVTKMSALTATALDCRRDLLAVHEPMLILNSTVVNSGQQTYHTITRELVAQRNENFIPKRVRNTRRQRSKWHVGVVADTGLAVADQPQSIYNINGDQECIFRAPLLSKLPGRIRFFMAADGHRQEDLFASQQLKRWRIAF